MTEFHLKKHKASRGTNLTYDIDLLGNRSGKTDVYNCNAFGDSGKGRRVITNDENHIT